MQQQQQNLSIASLGTKSVLLHTYRISWQWAWKTRCRGLKRENRERWCARAITVVPTPDSWSRRFGIAHKDIRCISSPSRTRSRPRKKDASGNISHTHVTRRKRCKIESDINVAMKNNLRDEWKNAHALVCITWCVRIHPLYFFFTAELFATLRWLTLIRFIGTWGFARGKRVRGELRAKGDTRNMWQVSEPPAVHLYTHLITRPRVQETFLATEKERIWTWVLTNPLLNCEDTFKILVFMSNEYWPLQQKWSWVYIQIINLLHHSIFT